MRTNQETVNIDGSQGEGGGQILRTALALSLVTGKPFAIEGIRAGRKKPGLMRQHLACVMAAAEVSRAKVDGARTGSLSLRFEPDRIAPGDYSWRIGSAGSSSLVMQTVLLPLLLGGGRSELWIEGGTHNGMAPPYPFLEGSFMPILAELGFEASLELERPGFYPAGGGAIRAVLAGRAERSLSWIEKRERTIAGVEVHAWSCGIPARIGRAEAEIVGRALCVEPERRFAHEVDAAGPGNAVAAVVDLGDGKAVFTSFGEPRLPLEKVAEDCVAQARRYIDSGARVDEHLQDQLLLPMALSGGGAFTTTEPSAHSRTNMETIKSFVDVSFVCEPLGRDLWEIRVSGMN